MSVEDVSLTGDALVAAVRAQVEYYFSKENLQSDAFLNSLMDAHNSVPLSAVMKFAKLKALTQDEEMVIQALTASTLVTFADGRIRTNAKTGRFTIILRDIPSDAPEEEIREIFAYENCKPLTSVRSELGDNWFVTMETEDDAKDTLLDLRVKKRTFRGQAVKGRLKSEPLVRSFYPIQTVPAPPFNGFMPPAVQMMPMSMGMYGYGMHGPELGMPLNMPMSMMPMGTVPPMGFDGEDSHEVIQEVVKDLVTSVSSMHGTPNGSVSDKGKGGRPANGQKNASSTAANGASASAAKKPAGKASSSERKVIDTSPLHFPPLASHEEGAAPTPGYKGAFVKYTADELVGIVEGIKEATLPDGIVPGAHLIAMEETANTNLLLRQRTFSIDETRELLRQGRPVQREAVLAGAVDLHSLMFGEADEREGPRKATGGSWAALVARAAGDTPAVTSAASVPKKSASKDKGEGERKTERTPERAAVKDRVAARSPRSDRSDRSEKRPEGRRKEAAAASKRSSEPASEAEHESPPQQQQEERQLPQTVVPAQPAVAQPAAVKSNGWGGKPTFANVLKQQQETAVKVASNANVPVSVSIQLESKEEVSSETTPTDSAQTESKSRDGMAGEVWTKENLQSLPPRKHNVTARVEKSSKKIDS